ncbi:MAG: LysR substrate-binding domain-containing protein [Sphingomonadaceae bacterium]
MRATKEQRRAKQISNRSTINRRWLPLNALRAFDAVGQNLSFTAGAAALSVSQSAMSRHVIGLEELLGKQLFDRDVPKLALTPAGAELLPVVTKCFDRLEQVMNNIRDDNVASRPLRIHIPPSLLQQLALPMLRDFRAEHPDMRIDVSSAHVTGLPATNIDMAIVFDRPNVDDRVTDLLWNVQVSPLCSPQTAAACAGKSLEAFLANQELLHVKLADEPRDLLWATFARQCGLHLITEGGLAFDTAIAAAQYAMGAAGVFLGDFDMFAQEIADGRLVMPYPTTAEDGFGYYLKLHADDLGDPAIALFRSWLINRFAQHPRRGADTARGSGA